MAWHRGEPQHRPVDLHLDAGRLVPSLLAATLVLTLASVPAAVLATGRALPVTVPGLATWVRLTDPVRAGGLASWLLAALCLAVALVAVTVGASIGRQGRPRAWRALAVVAALLSIDHVTGVHEWGVAGPVRGLLGGGLGDLAWGLVAAPLVVIALVACRGLLRGLPAPTASGLLLGLAVYLGGAVLLDVVCSVLRATAGQTSSMLAVGSLTEQAMELVGLTTVLAVLAQFVERLGSPEAAAPGTTFEMDLTQVLPPPPAGAAAPGPTPVAPAPWAIPAGAARQPYPPPPDVLES